MQIENFEMRNGEEFGAKKTQHSLFGHELTAEWLVIAQHFSLCLLPLCLFPYFFPTLCSVSLNTSRGWAPTILYCSSTINAGTPVTP